MTIRALLFLCLVSLATAAEAQSYYERFKVLSYETDTMEQRQLLAEWEAADKNDPQLYVSYFNYYFRKSRKSVVALNRDLPKNYNDKSLVIQDSAGEAAGFLYSDVNFNPELLKKATTYITTGIEKFPDRLDMRFGKVYMYQETQNYDAFTSTIIEAVNYSVKINNKWKWIEGKPLDDPKKFMLQTIQDYQMHVYDTGDDSLLIHMKNISEAVLKHYPDHVESLTDLSIYYLLFENYPASIEQLKKAEKFAPKDVIVLNNLAIAYQRSGDKQNAKKYYELVIKYGDEDAKRYAEESLEKLK